MQTDFLVVGQGIAGTVLTSRLMDKGCSVAVVDVPLAGSSSLVAAGLFNPLSGRKADLTWLYKDFWQEIQTFYPALEKKLNVTAFHLLPLFRPFETALAQNDALAKSENWPEFFQGIDHSLGGLVHAPFGGIKVKGSGYVDWPVLLAAFRKFLSEKNMLFEEFFNRNLLEIQKNQIAYQDIKAKAIIFCQGYRALQNPIFTDLPLRPAQGEILDVKFDTRIPCIINKNGWIVPGQNGICRAGATFNQTIEPALTQEGIKTIRHKIEQMTPAKFEIIAAKAGIRPATARRRPILKQHELFANVFVFNGLGSRGTAIAPLAAKWMCEWVLENKPLPKQIQQDVYF